MKKIKKKLDSLLYTHSFHTYILLFTHFQARLLGFMVFTIAPPPPHISTVSHVIFRLTCAQHSILVYLHTVAVSGVAFILFLFGPTLKPFCTHRRGKFLAVFLLPAKVSKVVCWKPVNNVAKDWICKAVTLSAFVLPSFVY